MNKLIKKTVEYLGINGPETIEELQVEIAGLEHLISMAGELICRHKQSLALVNLELKGAENELQNTSKKED
jgi:hypothetical protein